MADPLPLPWSGEFHFYCGSDHEKRLKQRITRAFEKAGEDGALQWSLQDAGEWQVQMLAERLFDKLEPYFQLPKEES